MKPFLSILIFLLFTINQAFSQPEFKKEWEAKANVKNVWNACNEDLSLILMGDLKVIQMFDGITGKPLWKFSAKEKLGVKTLKDWYFLTTKEGEPVQLIYKKNKEKDNTILFLNPRTGEINSTVTEEVLVEKRSKPVKKAKVVRSKAVFAEETYDEESDTYLEIGYKDKMIKSAMSGTMMELTINASGGYTWSTTIKGKCVRHLCDNLLSADESDMMVTIMASHGKVFVIYEGISVLDLKTGKVLWTTTFDNVVSSAGLKATQEIGRSPLPVADDEAVFICDFSKGEKAIKKLDINTGNLIWKSEKISGNDVISALFVMEHTLIAKFGGVIRKEKYIPSNEGPGTFQVKYAYEGTSEIRAYNVTNGKQVWNSDKISDDDKFSRSECTLSQDGNKLLACSNKNLYVIEPQTGKVISKTEFGTKQIGKPQYISLYDGYYIVEGEKGIASITQAGVKNYSVSTGKRLFTEFRGDAFIVWVGKSVDQMNQFVRFDLTTGKILGKEKACFKPRFDKTGDYYVKFDKQKITKLKTRP
jgi:outer membrane protein assembly factor BamB